MGFIKEYRFGRVQAFETGRGYWGKEPLITAFCYLVDGVMIDTGIRHARKQVLQAHRLWPVHKVCLTHPHEDHSGNAAAMRGLWGVPVYGHALCVQKMAAPFSILPYQHLLLGKSDPVEMEELPAVVDGETLKIVPIHTPGHCKDHTCYLVPEEGWLFSGDLFLGDAIKYFRSDEDLGAQIQSLRKVAALDFENLFCAHNPQPLEGKAHIVSKLSFLEDLYGNIAHLHSSGMGPKGIMRNLGIKDRWVVGCMTMGNVSASNMVRSALQTADAGGLDTLGA